MVFMTSQLSKWSFLVLLPALALNCDATEQDLADAQESDTGAFDHFRATLLASLEGSQFEIDIDANLTPGPDDTIPDVEDTHPLDWTVVADVPQSDTTSGKNDSSYTGGTKEDDVCPIIGTGSIPNNKSDLKHFSLYHEAGTQGHPGFIHLFWTRVQEPSGTTLMDFELNQSDEDCDNGSPQKQRTAGDFLLEYRLEQGGSTATIKLREWTGSAWGPAVDLTENEKAVGTINNSPILAADTGNPTLGPLGPRTFGEASIDLSAIIPPGTCKSFANAILKSRSSDTFTSALKDVIIPEVGINISTCGNVTIRKEIDPNPNDPALEFGFTLAHGMVVDSTFVLGHGGSRTFDDVQFGTYTVTEDQLDLGYNLKEIDCSDSSGVTPMINGDTVTFTIDADTDIVDCTFTNVPKPVTDLTCSVDSKPDGGTSSTIECWEDDPNDPLGTFSTPDSGDGSLSLPDLPAGTYTCEVVITENP
jgi:hypothetical protein